MTVSISDMTVPDEKKVILEKAEEKVEAISKKYRRGLVTDERDIGKLLPYGKRQMMRLQILFLKN